MVKDSVVERFAKCKARIVMITLITLTWNGMSLALTVKETADQMMIPFA